MSGITIPAAVSQWWFAPGEIIEVVTISGGLSGSQVWRVGCVDGSVWALKRWGASVSQPRLEFIFKVLQRVRAAHFPLIPAARSQYFPASETRQTVASNRRHMAGWIWFDQVGWDCCQWVEGTELKPDQELLQPAEQVAQAAAEFSQAAEAGESTSFLASAQASAPSPAILARRERIEWLDDTFARVGPPDQRRLILGEQLRRRQLSPLLERQALTALQVWQLGWMRQRVELLNQLRSWSEILVPQCHVLGDLHLGNCLFRDGNLVSLVDFDAVRVDSAAVDLSRLLSSLELIYQGADWQQREPEIWQRLLAAYGAIRPFNQQEVELTRCLVACSPLINLGNWVHWLLIEHRDFPGPEAMVWQRMFGWSRLVASRLNIWSDMI
ncbi:phosphotransferase [Planctomycetaceae bacterium SH139]